jgi:hypothetical protein
VAKQTINMSERSSVIVSPFLKTNVPRSSLEQQVCLRDSAKNKSFWPLAFDLMKQLRETFNRDKTLDFKGK